MALQGTAKAPAKKPTAKISLPLLLDQLDTEWTDGSREERTQDEALLRTYFHCCVRPALHWIAGDPYTFEFPAAYQGERLAKLCGYLKGLQAADAEKVQAARELNVVALRRAAPAYLALAYPDMPTDGSLSVTEWECPPFSWEAIETLWDGENWTGEGEKARALFLPQFRYRETADFHLAGLAVLFLNRQLRLPLSDLTPQGGN